MSGSGRTPRAFAALVKKHLRSLDCPQKDLAEACGFAASDVNAWLSGGSKIVSRQAISRLAFGLTSLYEKRSIAGKAPSTRKRGRAALPPPESNPGSEGELDAGVFDYRSAGDLEHILHALLESAGYLPSPTGLDLLWHRLAGSAERRVRVGWYPSYPLAYLGPDGKLTGIAKLVTEQVLAFMGLKPDWEACSVSGITADLLQGRIDMVCCQYINVAPRTFDVWISKPLPRLRLYPAALVQMEHARALSDGATICFDKIQPVHSRTAIGRSLCHFVKQLPGRDPTGKDKDEFEKRLLSLPLVHAESPAAAGEAAPAATLRELCEDVIRSPKASNGRVRCFFTDALTVQEAVSGAEGTDGRLFREPIPGAAALNLPKDSYLPFFAIGFALHPREGGKLGYLLNQALERLRELDYYRGVAYQPWMKFLQDAKAAPEKPLSGIREECSDFIKRIQTILGDPND